MASSKETSALIAAEIMRGRARSMAELGVILEALKKSGAVKMVVYYTCSSDAGMFDRIEKWDKDGNVTPFSDERTVKIVRGTSKFLHGKWVETEFEVETPLDKAFKDFVYGVLATSVDFESEGAGDGAVTFNLETDEIELNHRTPRVLQTITEFLQ